MWGEEKRGRIRGERGLTSDYIYKTIGEKMTVQTEGFGDVN